MKRIGALLLVLAAAPAALAAQGAVGKITIEGTSSVRAWECAAPRYEMSVSPASRIADPVLSGQKAVESLALVVDARGIECGNGKMNDHLRKTLGAESFPEIRFVLGLYEITTAGEGAVVEAEGTLTIAGRDRPARLKVAVTRDAAGMLRAGGEYVIDMTDHGLKPPTLMLGTLKVGQEVTVRFDVPVSSTRLATALEDLDSN